MKKTIAVDDLQRRLSSVLDEVARERTPYVLTHEDQPRAALVSYGEFLRFQELEERDVLKRFRRLRARMARATTGVSDEEVAREVAAARAELES